MATDWTADAALSADSAVAAPAVAAWAVAATPTAPSIVAAPMLFHAVLGSSIVGHASEASGIHAAYKVTAHFIGLSIMGPVILNIDHHIPPKPITPPVKAAFQARVVPPQPPTVHPQILTGARRVQATPRTSPVRVKR